MGTQLKRDLIFSAPVQRVKRESNTTRDGKQLFLFARQVSFIIVLEGNHIIL